jgi:hypothetical protein
MYVASMIDNAVLLSPHESRYVDVSPAKAAINAQ